MIASAYSAYPLEACGLLVGVGADVHRFVPCTNEAASAKVYAIPGRELLRAERAAEAETEVAGMKVDLGGHLDLTPWPRRRRGGSVARTGR